MMKIIFEIKLFYIFDIIFKKNSKGVCFATKNSKLKKTLKTHIL